MAVSNTSSTSDDGILELPLTPFDELLNNIRPLLRSCNVLEHKKDILAQMCSYDSRSEDWCHYAHFDESGYTRNLVEEDDQHHFNIVAMCWRPGQSSAIHGHEGANCFIKVLCGTLTEERHDYPNGSEAADDNKHGFVRRVLDTNNVDYIDDTIGVHKMINCSQRDAVSLHIYAPPYKECRIFSLESLPTPTTRIINDSPLSSGHHDQQSLTTTMVCDNGSDTPKSKKSAQPVTSKVVTVLFYRESSETGQQQHNNNY